MRIPLKMVGNRGFAWEENGHLTATALVATYADWQESMPQAIVRVYPDIGGMRGGPMGRG